DPGSPALTPARVTRHCHPGAFCRGTAVQVNGRRRHPSNSMLPAMRVTSSLGGRPAAGRQAGHRGELYGRRPRG
ncbi:MAG TPA: hypothetical protein VMV92_13545, partial [Streptosporangiaceae bacterium]|nr:hypothetical protein [Streptosporangiaceae bacterium]